MRFDNETGYGPLSGECLGQADGAVTVFRPVLIESDDRLGLCLLQSLSSVDMLGTIYGDFQPGEAVRVRLCSGSRLRGRVAWARYGRVGIRFDGAIDVAETIRAMNAEQVDGKINRSTRIAVDCPGELLLGAKVVPFRLKDISQRGLKAVVGTVELEPKVVVRLEGLDPREASVRWTKDGAAGMRFIRPLGFEELAEWLVRRPWD